MTARLEVEMMPRKRQLTKEEKRRIEKLWLSRRQHHRVAVEKPVPSDSAWIESKTDIRRTQVAKQLQDLWMKKYGPNTPFPKEQKERIEKLLRQRVPPGFDEAGYTPARWISYVTRIHQPKVAGWISELNKTKNAVLIIDTTSPSKEGMSMSDFLRHLLRIYNSGAPIKSNPQPVKAKDDFIRFLKKARERVIHISAHGSAHDEYDNQITSIQAGIWKEFTAQDILKDDDGEVIRSQWSKRNQKPQIIVASSCEVGRRDLAKAFWKVGCEYYIAPLRKVPWINAAVFSTLFYYYLLLENWSPFQAFSKTMDRLPNQIGTWTFFAHGKKKPYRRRLQTTNQRSR